jgi:hypothetical protein
MKSPFIQATATTIAILCAVALLVQPVSAYIYCGAHDRRYEMRVYYWNSSFWVDMLQQEASKWNAVHSVLSINREKRASFPAKSGDGQSVIGWLSDTDLRRIYNRPWGLAMGVTFTKREKNCGRILETDVIFNPAQTLFTPQTEVPYSQGYQEAALHELGHVLSLQHEERGLALMAASPAVSDVLHHNEKVGWVRSAAQRFNPLPSPVMDMGVFPLRKGDGSEVYADVSPRTVSPGDNVTISDLSVENLSNVFPETNPRFNVVLENTANGAVREIGWFSWANFRPFSSWNGNLTYRIPSDVEMAEYRVAAIYQGKDQDRSNDRAVFGKIVVVR